MPSPLGSHDASPMELQARLQAERREEPFLLYRDGNGDQRIILLDVSLERVAVGRRPESDVPLPWDVQVSRLHAVLERVGGQWTVVDDGMSRNGTHVNEGRVSGRRRLLDGDVVRCGETRIAFCDPAHGASQPTSAGATDVPTVELTNNQRAVLLALSRPFASDPQFARPASNRAIAEELGYTVDGVKTHMRALFRKLAVPELAHNEKRMELVERAVRAGLVSPRDLRPPNDGDDRAHAAP